MRRAVSTTLLLAAAFLAPCKAHPSSGWKRVCPQADFLMPCRCIEAQIGLRVLCSGISSRRHLQVPFDYLRLYDLNTLTLQRVDFPITVDLFKGLNVVIIKILDSTFKVLDPPEQQGADTNLVLGNKLEGLDVRQTTLDLGNTNLGAMKSLKHVMVDASTINVLRKNWFHGLTRVTSFVIEHTSIARVEDEALSGLDSVEEIKLAANQLSAVQRNYFPNVASKLSHLDLR
ncbi:hypothetical protein HPB48_017652 [Haemaphysalis longicornis]|uniref:Uncharacterized protein n=1 Tax=Haemaphysalis longicornis TaxID=44386 RepID=A0A9J6GW74_HAELO|nr:hypothetical protein HPB48_017652 [Haemaphysalis longicornis]